MNNAKHLYLTPIVQQVPLEGKLPLCTSTEGTSALTDMDTVTIYDEFAN
ncbi:MAG: hypothetical protein J6Y32_08050 [Bacteroidales bacterium]|nr:hypothetical protein [Bacteroidales bacterium]